MHWIDIVTWIAALTLIVGSAAIFVWFLFDTRALLRRERGAGEQVADDDVA